LRKTFQAYDKEGKGNLSFDSFRHMLSRLDNSISEEDAKAVFDVIDADSSNSIEFE
jgi:Ca2+-binding EF-hand superfamily protein